VVVQQALALASAGGRVEPLKELLLQQRRLPAVCNAEGEVLRRHLRCSIPVERLGKSRCLPVVLI
jgi:hypothetical protein